MEEDGFQLPEWFQHWKTIENTNTKYPYFPQFYSLWPSDTIWRQRSGSTLAHWIWVNIGLTAPSHYLNKKKKKLSNLPTHQQKPMIWLRYIDDIFAIWPHGKDSLLKFNSWLNSRHPRIQFTCIYSDTSVDFLDTTVKLEDGSLQTELFIKPTSSLSYLQRNSCHPTHVFQALPYAGTALPSNPSTTSQTSFWKLLSDEDTTVPPYWGTSSSPRRRQTLPTSTLCWSTDLL